MNPSEMAKVFNVVLEWQNFAISGPTDGGGIPL